jgi:hypothetical protein
VADPSIKDLAYRGLAATLGGPVDIATMVMRPFGYKLPDEQIIGGSEWIGKKMENVGLVSSARSPVKEFAASMIVPSPDDLYRAAAFAPALIGSVKGLGKVDDALRATSKVDNVAYRGSHTAPGPDFGAPLYDLTGGGQMYPADVYSPKAAQYYGTGYPAADREAFALAQRVRGNPDATVTIYRAVPKDPNIKSINQGDWVTLSKEYAKTHGESVLENKYKIISQKVKAKDLWTNADSIHEFGYWPAK